MTDSKEPQGSGNQAEELLIREALNGEEEAIVHLYHRHVTQLYRFAFSKLNNQEDAEDITSETFLQAVKNLRAYSGKSSFKNWLYGIAKNLILAKYRERYRESTMELDENVVADRNPAGMEESEFPDPKADFLGTVLSLLPENYRNVLELRYLKGYSIIETAEALGITEENAKVLQHRALKKANRLAMDAGCNPPNT